MSTVQDESKVNIPHLIRKRGIVKAQLTRFEKYLDGFSSVSTVSPVDIIEIKVRLSKIELHYSEFDEIQIQIECMCDDPEEQEIERGQFETKYYKTVARAQVLVAKPALPFRSVSNDSLAESVVQRNPVGSSVSSCGESFNNKLIKVKLPTISLPKFDGNYSKWLEFRDTFKSLVHDNNNIDTIAKFNYLRTSLEGAASTLICSLQLTINNYAIAWDSLIERFDNNRLLTNSYVKTLFDAKGSRGTSKDIRSLVDIFTKNLRCLQSLGENVDGWDTILIFMVTSKLDTSTLKEWELHRGTINKVKYVDLIKFLKDRADIFESLESNSKASVTSNSKVSGSRVLLVSDSQYTPPKCVICKGEHFIYKCSQFINEPISKRVELTKQFKLCENCLKVGHNVKKCSHGNCRLCKERHNTLLHPNETDNALEKGSSVVLSASIRRTGLLSTAVIRVYDYLGNPHNVRVLLDSGSASCFVTEKLARILQPSNLKSIGDIVIGINNCRSQISASCILKGKSIHNNFEFQMYCLVINRITEPLPVYRSPLTGLHIPENLELADPEFYETSDIDILIGADLFWDIVTANSKQLSLGKNKPYLRETKLGWILTGCCSSPSKILCHFSSNIEIQEQLETFWKLEEICDSSPWSIEEQDCDNIYKTTTKRLPDGRFVVEIPLKQSASTLGDSLNLARKRFFSLERRLHKDQTLFLAYKDFIDEYESLGHMTKVVQADTCNNTYYLPHHAVVRNDRTTTKLRVVYDASAKTTNGLSFNDIQMIGPTIQNDIVSILLRFRQHAIVASADIAKMYRQILVKEEQRSLQRILWRTNTTEPLSIYQLNTVTYGTASAPFLSIRCLKQLADECKDPIISTVIENDFYVDDLLTGGDTIEEATKVCLGVDKQLKSGCFELRKWRSNNDDLLQNLSYLATTETHTFNDAPTAKVLGLQWNSKEDTLCYKVNHLVTTQSLTKRLILSMISQIFDPLGLTSPTTIRAKILLQGLWIKRLSWDDVVPTDISDTWNSIIQSLLHLNNLRIPRHVLNLGSQRIELHNFCDASEMAYGACVYIRSIVSYDTVHVRLLCAKAKVAPLKSTTIPRLELCGALLASRLSKKVEGSLRLSIAKIVFWSDSSIVLSWLNSQPCHLKTFVRNRVAKIQEATASHSWKYVPTEMNPADVLSRGHKADNIIDNTLWWHGPTFLSLNESYWPIHESIPCVNLPEQRLSSSALITTLNEVNVVYETLERSCTLSKAKRVLGYVLRFINNAKSMAKYHPKQTGHLTCEELKSALRIFVRDTQTRHFSKEINVINSGSTCLPAKSSLQGLLPFFSPDGILRIRGRLQKSDINYDTRHPIILPKNDLFTRRVIEDQHQRAFHAGPQLLLAMVRQQYWPIGGRNLTRQIIRKCVTCAKLAARVNFPLMGDFPSNRVSASLPFSIVGIDYAGPLMIASKKGRGAKMLKSYICVIVCFSTKAIHLELVTDLSSATFILALKRFIARRGKPSHIYSDNGSNFVGAWNEIKQRFPLQMSSDGIQFHFIPPHAPHMGGLWEAGVKSTKYHLRRVLGSAHLTFEEMSTILCQIEAILNSRPLTILSSSPNDLQPLTPGHFLIGRPLTALPDPNTSQNGSHSIRFERITQLRKHFWQRWNIEYLSQLQQRCKWKEISKNIQKDTIVLIKEPESPPMKWRLGKVEDVHPGADGVVRVVSVRTSNGVLRRPTTGICPLPTEES